MRGLSFSLFSLNCFSKSWRVLVALLLCCMGASVVWAAQAEKNLPKANASINSHPACVPAAQTPSVASKPHSAPVRLLLQWMPQAQFAGYVMALEKGFFREEGVPHVELLWTKLGDTPLHRLASGEVDFAAAWLVTALQRRAENLPIVNVAQYMNGSDSLLVARKDKGIRTIDDLNGKTILSWGGDFGFEFELFLKKNNIKPARVLPLSSSLAPFLYGLADAMQAMGYSEYLRLIERGVLPEEMVVFRFADYNVNLVGDGLYTTQAYLKNNADVVRAVRRAVTRGWAYAFANEEETVGYVLAHGDAWNFRSNRTYQINMLRSIRALIEHRVGPNPSQWGTLNPEDFEAARALVVYMGLPLEHEQYETFFQAP